MREDPTKMHRIEVGRGGLDRIYVAQKRVHRYNLEFTKLKLRVYIKDG